VERHPARIAKVPGGQFNLPVPFTGMIMGYSKNQEAARDFLRWVHSEPVFAEWFASQQGYADAATRMWEKDKLWDAEPVLLPFRDIPRLGRRQMDLRRDRQGACVRSVARSCTIACC
jgi:ABC-type glycerol-3-phosphate transport system substrate-binding protein